MVSLSDMSSLARIGSEVGRVFDESLKFFAHDTGWAGRTGAYFCLADVKTGLPIMVLSIGSVSPEKGEKYLANCIEKTKRLAAHPEQLSSWESRDPAKNQWGGAVRGNYIYSLSGLPELGDEAVMLALMLLLQGHSLTLEDISQRTKNPYYVPLLKYLARIG